MRAKSRRQVLRTSAYCLALEGKQRHAARGYRQRSRQHVQGRLFNGHARRLARLVVGHRVAGDLPAAARPLSLCPSASEEDRAFAASG